ncbi:MAG TPA: GDSL-type esterase/lipase family protein [Solirubrobacter sp.]|nr:GDSL-type esterase/lipase family protein [Solirubrobacter sp.]
MSGAGDCRLGVLAFGDSITNGGGELQWGVALQSWALWVARGLGLPFTSYAVDGARVRDVVREQIAAFEARGARPGARYDLGCLYAGVNDVRAPDWDPDAFAADFATALAALDGRCDRLLAVTLPLDLGRPRAPQAALEAANATVEAVARAHGALVLDLRGFGARNLVMTDHVHPTAFGQVAIAERALAVLARDGADVRVRPSALIRPAERTPLRALKGDWTYAYRRLKVAGREVRSAAAARRAARAASGSPASSRTSASRTPASP